MRTVWKAMLHREPTFCTGTSWDSECTVHTGSILYLHQEHTCNKMHLCVACGIVCLCATFRLAKKKKNIG